MAPGVNTGVMDGADNNEAFPKEAGSPSISFSIIVTSQPLLIKFNAEEIPIMPAPTIVIFLF